jgi:sulfatase maturation enzyme AslB (radical SAM superfamily)
MVCALLGHYARAWKPAREADEKSLLIERLRSITGVEQDPERRPAVALHRDHPRMSVALSRMLCIRQRSSGRRNYATRAERSQGKSFNRWVLNVVDQLRPLHLSIVGGDPLVRYRELEKMLPLLLARGIHVQIVTSAFRPWPVDWTRQSHLNVVVSIDGLQPEHDIRRKPATYERILKNIEGQEVTIHCTITAQMMRRPGYLKEFLSFWTSRPQIEKIWFSIFTPQKGDQLDEMPRSGNERFGDAPVA